MGIFLAVKSAYPSVHRERLIHILKQKSYPPYLCYVINSLLSDRTTSLKIDRFVSQVFTIPNGLPQGSPLLVTLYLLYNSSLLLPNPPSLNEDEISIAYIYDFTHLIETESVQQSQKRTEEVMTRSKSWGSRYRAVFDEKKTNFIIFTKRRQPLHEITITASTHALRKEVRWLGITLTPTLSPGPHFRTIKTKANNTINQLK
ncbi:hypothetical protein O181_019691 [Austropuccinia psidii MF-1]|uniref:Reverse transcriptase domain-containing protein n=1 Tax=Austropuccinia psidii MF-1 TaxID=1389203 RepID=A0A9Q3CC25_9BASI|nr:hypothetical protein [Austropuccinia psidii MF-1]